MKGFWFISTSTAVHDKIGQPAGESPAPQPTTASGVTGPPPAMDGLRSMGARSHDVSIRSWDDHKTHGRKTNPTKHDGDRLVTPPNSNHTKWQWYVMVIVTNNWQTSTSLLVGCRGGPRHSTLLYPSWQVSHFLHHWHTSFTNPPTKHFHHYPIPLLPKATINYY